ncbi:MAG: DUF1552 domain-containing protein [Verrucomicrobiales bacterium]|nr:DUF1552 domain-containing protein [Verrucomicrobiales bacterium]
MKITSRRNFLRGAGGAVLGLPFLESLSFAKTVAKPAQRLAFYYVPIGVVRRAFFPDEQQTPEYFTSDPDFQQKVTIKPGLHEFPDTQTLGALKPVRDKVTMITGMDRLYQHGTDVHAQCGSCFLSSATVNTVTESAYPLARTFDHIVADQIGGKTPFRTLEFSANSHKDNKESIYFDNISWYGTDHVAPSMRDPRKAYRRLFSTEEIQTYRNITDLVLEDAKSMQRNLGYTDRQKFEEYFESIRAIETQMDRLEKMRSELADVNLEEPPEAYLPRGEYIRLMGDLMVVSLQAGLTNVATFMVGPERWDTPYKFEGLFDKPMSHHQMSHNQKKFVTELEMVDYFHMEIFADLVAKMAAIEEADGSSLLDNTIFTYGSGLGDGATHQYSDLPIIMAGNAREKFAGGLGGKHLHVPDRTPLANLWLTYGRAMGLEMERFADSDNVVGQLLKG